VVVGIESQFRRLSRRLGFDDPREVSMSAEPLRASEAARQLGIPTRELMQLIHDRKIRYVMIDGIAHVPVDALTEYRSKAS
jgi:excisionase family DNA binding protein